MPARNNHAFAFRPFSPKQLKLMYWYMDGSPYQKCDTIIADGAIRSGKTIAMICGFFRWSLAAFYGETFILAGKTIGALKKNVIGPALQILRGWGLSYVYVSSGDEARIEVGENVYYLYDAHNERSQDRLQGLTAAGALADEVALFPRSFVEQMVARCSVDGARIWLNCNPENPAHFVKTELIDKASEKNICHLHFLMADNLTLTAKTRERYERMFSGVFYQRFILGEWVKAEGLVYPMFDRERNVTSERGGPGRYWISSDYGTQNPTVFALWREYGGKAVMEKEYYHSGRESGRQKTDEEYYQDLEAFADGYRIERVVLDPSAASFAECIRRHGKFSVWKANNAVLDGIRFTGACIKSGIIKFHESCKNAFREFGLYSWDKDAGEDRVIKENDHVCDSIRYFCMTVLRREIKK